MFSSITYEGSPDEVPHEVDLILRSGRRHVCLLQIRRHRRVMCKLFEQELQGLHELLPFFSGGRWDRLGGEVSAKLLPGTCIRIHCNGI